MVGRTAFGGDLLYSVAVSGFIYPILGHWVWGPDGWLATMKTPFHDFAGSTVVHSIGGFIALAGAIALGPRIGRKFKRDGGGMPPGHDMAIAAVGGVILWFGWYGFNPGSTLSAMDFEGIGRVATNTTLAACGGRSRCDVLRLSTSAQVGHGHLDQRLLRRTGRDHVSVLLGVAVRGDLHRRHRRCRRRPRHRPARVPADRRPDRSVARPRTLRDLGNVESRACSPPVSTAAATSTGPDPSTSFKGLFYGGGFHQLQFQIFGSLRDLCVRRSRIALVVMYAVKALGILRISPEHELEGLDIVEHGAPAYHPEYAYMGYSPIPGGKSGGVAIPHRVQALRRSASGNRRAITCISSPPSSKRTESKQ